MKSRLMGVLVAVLVMTAAFALPASAAYDPFGEACKNGGGSSNVCSSDGSDPITGANGVIVNVTSILALIAGIVSVAFIVWGGIKYITSGGDSSGVSSAKNTIIAALIGLVVAAMAKPVVLFVIGRL